MWDEDAPPTAAACCLYSLMEQLLRCSDVGGGALREGFSKTAGLRVALMWLLVYKAIYEQELILNLRVGQIQLQLLQESQRISMI